jgi:hypothetical protein
MSDPFKYVLPFLIMSACAIAMLSDLRKANRRSRLRDDDRPR